MIALDVVLGNRPRAKQSATAPFVYLDQWAYMALAKDQGQLQRFADEIVRSEGTLAFSMANYYELSQISDIGQLGRIEDLFRQIWPRLAFLNSDPTAVIENEDEVWGDTSNQAPHLDDWMLNKYVERYRPSVNPRDPRGFLLQFRDPHPGIAYDFQSAYGLLVKGFKAAVEKTRCMYQRDDSARREVNSSPTGERVPHPTRHILDQAVKSIVKGNFNVRDPNEVADFLHMVVPVSYCSLVLLDKAWAEWARRVQKSVRHAGLLTHDAAVFSPKTLDQFWAAIGRYRPSCVQGQR
jgi:hypothetical protein